MRGDFWGGRGGGGEEGEEEGPPLHILRHLPFHPPALKKGPLCCYSATQRVHPFKAEPPIIFIKKHQKNKPNAPRNLSLPDVDEGVRHELVADAGNQSDRAGREDHLQRPRVSKQARVGVRATRGEDRPDFCSRHTMDSHSTITSQSEHSQSTVTAQPQHSHSTATWTAIGDCRIGCAC